MERDSLEGRQSGGYDAVRRAVSLVPVLVDVSPEWT
jgi:hypothetical protein